MTSAKELARHVNNSVTGCSSHCKPPTELACPVSTCHARSQRWLFRVPKYRARAALYVRHPALPANHLSKNTSALASALCTYCSNLTSTVSPQSRSPFRCSNFRPLVHTDTSRHTPTHISVLFQSYILDRLFDHPFAITLSQGALSVVLFQANFRSYFLRRTFDRTFSGEL